MARFEYRIVNVFTPAGRGDGGWAPRGNPLAVFPDARGLDPALFQPIAFQLNLSETTFVLPTDRADCDVRVRIFTPRAELPMAGHPTIGTAFVLDRGDRVVFEEGVGPVPVERVRDAGGAAIWRMSQPRPHFGVRFDDTRALALALSLDAADLDEALPCEVVATGPPFLIVPLRSVDALSRARLRAEAWEPIERAVDGAQPYLFARTGTNAARCRLFAPALGITEDPATGGAAGPLGAYALAHGVTTPEAGGVARLRLAQGIEMGRPSELRAEVEGAGHDVRAVRVGGACETVGGGWFDL